MIIVIDRTQEPDPAWLVEDRRYGRNFPDAKARLRRVHDGDMPSGRPEDLPQPPPGMRYGVIVLYVAPGQRQRLVSLVPAKWMQVPPPEADLLTHVRQTLAGVMPGSFGGAGP